MPDRAVPRHRRPAFGAAAGAAVLLASLLAAAAAPAFTAVDRAPLREDGRPLCRTLPDLGSRLSKRRVCTSRAQ